MKKKYYLDIKKEFSGQRLDIAIINSLPEDITRSSLKNHLLFITVNNKEEKLSYKCKENDKVIFEVELENYDNIIPENIPLNIVYEDDNYLVINKNHNMVTHPARGNLKGTIVNALLGMRKELYIDELQFKIGIVHRLDKETSGLIIVAKNKDSHQYLTNLFKNRSILKKYHAITHGFFVPSHFIIENNIGRHPKNRKKMAVLSRGGKKSITIIESVKHIKNYSYLDIRLITGRTHQIRVHLSNYGFPIVGDKVYYKRNIPIIDIPLCLVSYKLSFYDMFTKKKIEIEIEDPSHMKELL